MKRIRALAIAVLVASCAACTAPPGNSGARTKKAAEQRLAAYTPIRRLTYRDACGNAGPLSICVERISISESATLVEARVRNSSAHPYTQGPGKGTSVLLADASGMTLVRAGGEATEYPARQEKVVRFRMEGGFAGEPALVMVNNLRRRGAGPAEGGVSLTAKLTD